MSTHQDFCKGPRQFYKAFLKLCTTYPVVGVALFSVPLIESIGFIAYIYNLRSMYIQTSILSYIQGPIWMIFSTMVLANILAYISIYKILPNLLTISKVYYSAIGYWSLTNIILLVVSGYAFYLPYIIPFSTYLLFYCQGCLLSADILRSFRLNMYQTIEAQTDEPIIVSVSV